MNQLPTVAPPLRFSRRRPELLRHVEKHVLERREERWHQLLDADAVAKARDEAAQGIIGSGVAVVCCQYLAYAEKTAVDRVNQSDDHAWFVHRGYEHPEVLHWAGTCWKADDRTLVGIDTVPEVGQGTWRLTTCHRIGTPRTSGKALERAICERLEARMADARLIAVADPGVRNRLASWGITCQERV